MSNSLVESLKMSILLVGSVDCEVYHTAIRYDGLEYLTLGYYTKAGEALLHDTDTVVCFSDEAQMMEFCINNGLKLSAEVFLYDFDVPIRNPVGYSDVLDKWNMLNTIAGLFGMYFEGDRRKYNGIYDLLFRLSTSAVPIQSVQWLSKRHILQLQRIFRKQGRYFKKFQMYATDINR